MADQFRTLMRQMHLAPNVRAQGKRRALAATLNRPSVLPVQPPADLANMLRYYGLYRPRRPPRLHRR
jgi:hypothetical protein